MTATSARPRDDGSSAPVDGSQPLSAGVRRGVVWSMANTLLLRLAGILTTAAVARILDPRDFGVFAVASTAYVIVSSLRDVGVSSCLIRADLSLDNLAPTMVSVSLTTSALLSFAMVAFAEPIATALGSAAAAEPIRVMSLTMILVGIFSVPNAQLVRDFKQDKLFLAQVISFVPSTILLIVLAKSGSGAMAFAWSRVLGQLVSGIVVVVSVQKHYRPGVARSAFSLLFRFGLPLAAANFVNYILLNVDYALVGHLMGAVALGTYVLAFNVASWPASFLSGVINNVSMPAFSRVKHDAERFKTAMASSFRAVSLLVMPMCAFTMALARPLVLTLYGAKWAAAASVLSVLALYGALSVICLLCANILAALGRTRFLLVIQLIWLGALAPAMALGVHRDGIVGAAFAHVVVIGPIVLPSYLFALRRTTKVNLTVFARAVAPPILASAVAAFAAVAAAMPFATPVGQLAAGLAAGSLVYLLAAGPIALALLQQGGKPASVRVRRLWQRHPQPQAEVWAGIPPELEVLLALSTPVPPSRGMRQSGRMAQGRLANGNPSGFRWHTTPRGMATLLHLYDGAARTVGLPTAFPPKHSAKRVKGVFGHRGVTEEPSSRDQGSKGRAMLRQSMERLLEKPTWKAVCASHRGRHGDDASYGGDPDGSPSDNYRNNLL